MLRRNFLFLPRRGMMTAGATWRMPGTTINKDIQFYHHFEGIRHNSTIINNTIDNNNPAAPIDPPLVSTTGDENSQSVAEDRIIESALNTPIIDLIKHYVVPIWSELEKSNIDTLGSWLNDRQNTNNRRRQVTNGLVDQFVKSCFTRQLDEINALNSKLATRSSENEESEEKRRQARISSVSDGRRLQELQNISLDRLSPTVLVSTFQNGETVRDWLIQSCPEKSQPGPSPSLRFNPYQAKLQSVSIIFAVVGFFIREHHSRALLSILRQRYRQLLLQVHHKNTSARGEILAGSSHRHTNFPFTGLLGRELLIHKLVVQSRMFGQKKEQLTKERLALFTVSSLPRQGKTALLDWIGYDREILAAFAAAEYENGIPIFVLNMTFNALWHSPNLAESESAFEFATTQMKLRLLAAGLSKFNGNAFANELKGDEKMLLYMIVAAETVASCFQQVVAPSLRSLLPHNNFSSETQPAKTILLFDEFSNIEPRRNSMPPFEFENLRESIYSAATELIDHSTLVVVSGFTTAPALASRSSGRVICDLTIEPVVSSVQSRETLPMRSQYFGMIGRSSQLWSQIDSKAGSNDNIKQHHLFDAPMVVYELAKPSLGVLGAILELGRDDGRSRLSSIVHQIPFLTRLKQDHTLCEEMVKILKYKSFQFLPSELLATSPLFKSLNADLVDAVYCSAVFTDGTQLLDGGAPSPSSKALLDAHIEPLFLAHALETSGADVGNLTEFPLFLQQLARYSDAVLNPIETAAMNREMSIATEFGRFPHGNPQRSNNHTNRPSIKTLTNCVFQSVLLTGILFQRQLRHSLLASANSDSIFPIRRFWKFSRHDFTGLECRLSDFLRGSSEIITLANDSKSQPCMLCWNEFSSSSTTTIHRFNHNRTPYPHLKVNNLKSDGKLCEENLSFSLDSVHIPQRPETNPLADIIFHEQSSDGRLVQFWIDTKHSDGDPMPDLDISDAGAQLLASSSSEKSASTVSTTLILESLKNPLLQDPNCSVDHIVHIVVTSWSRQRQRRKLEDLLATASCARLPSIRDESQVLGRLASYSLFYVRPEDVAFENLVSEPIKLGMPLLEEVDADTWAQKLPEKISEWSKYKAVKRDPSMVMQLTSADFEHLKNLAFVEDCAMTMLHSAVDFGFASKALVSMDQKSLFEFLPFGTWLDALGALPSGWNSKPFFKKATLRQDPHEQFEFEVESEVEDKPKIIYLRSDFVQHVTQNVVTIGHLFHNRPDMARRDAITDQLWDSFIDPRRGDDEVSKNLRLACGILWTTTIKEWNEDIKFSTKLPKSSALLKHDFATKSTREIIKELEDSDPRKLKSIKNGGANERIEISEVIQHKVEEILKLINVN